eukprot:TRINITY_DN7609_c0_g2_i1.p1 TRINITY_DN7609_c0_g2~~TRINITY_DN7609_c0_g2_i1.p1  ORF type:complete len:1813 (+),score=581.62 TRINITY_DN7609_c0_g2_i1:164-5440(+)
MALAVPRLQKCVSMQALPVAPSLEMQKSLMARMVLELAGQGELRSTFKEKEGCVVLLDIAKFSKITALMKKAGPGSSELVTTEVNKFFAKMIREVVEADGDIISFSGDAMLVVWESTPAIPLLKAVLQASACALQLAGMNHPITALRDHIHSSGVALDTAEQELLSSTEAFTVHTGMALGKLHLLVAGGKGCKGSSKWVYTLEGQPINEVGITLNLSKSGEIAVTEDIVDYLEEEGYSVDYATRGESETAIIRPGDIRPVIACPPLPKRGADLPTDHLKDRVPQLYYDTVEKAVVTGVEGELRTTVVVFVKLVTLSKIENGMDEDQFRQFQKVIASTQKLLHTYDGVFNKVIIDDKGVVLLFLFGVPLHTHEDDPERAVEFSLKVVHKVKTMGQAASIGITRSKVFCGMTGSTQRQEYSTLGNGVNMAARLMCEAEKLWEGADSYVLVDEEMMNACVQSRRLNTSFLHVEEYNLMLNYQFEVYQVQPGEDGESSDSNESTASHISGVGAVLDGLGDTRRTSGRRFLHSIGSSRSSSSLPISPIPHGLKSSESSRSLSRTGSVRSNQSKSSLTSGLHRKVVASRTGSNPPSTPQQQPGSLSPRGGVRPQPVNMNGKSPGARPLPGAMMKSGLPRTSSQSSVERQQRQQQSKRRVPTILGRKVETQAVQSFVAAVAEGRWQDKETAMCFAGDRQTGKTTFLEHVAEHSRTLEVAVYFLHGHETFSEMAYSAIAPLIEQILAVHPPSTFKQCLPEAVVKMSPLLHHVIRVQGLGMPEGDLAAMAPREKVTAVNQVLLALLKLLSRNAMPIIILVDDVQWIDGMSLGFFKHAMQEGVKMIIASRDTHNRFGYSGTQVSSIKSWRSFTSEASSEESAELSGGLGATDESAAIADEERSRFYQHINEYARHCTLRALPERLAADLLKGVFDTDAVDPRLEAILWRKSGGYPGFLTKMAQALVAEDYVRSERGVTVLRRPSQDLSHFLVRAVPVIETHVLKQMDGLTGPQKTVLSVAAVLSTFTMALLEACVAIFAGADESDYDLGQVVNVLKNHHLIRRLRAGEYEFSLELARDVVYYSILRKERVLMHAAVLRATVGTPTFTDANFIRHMREAEIDGMGLDPDVDKAVADGIASGALPAAYTALHRPRKVPTDTQLHAHSLNMIGIALETGNFRTALAEVRRLRHKRRGSSIWVEAIQRTKKCFCCVTEWQTLPKGLALTATYRLTVLEAAFYAENLKLLRKGFAAVSKMQDEHPLLNLAGYLSGVRRVVRLAVAWRNDPRPSRVSDNSSGQEVSCPPGTSKSRSVDVSFAKHITFDEESEEGWDEGVLHSAEALPLDAEPTKGDRHLSPGAKYRPESLSDRPSLVTPFDVLCVCMSDRCLDNLLSLLSALRDAAVKHGADLTDVLVPRPPTGPKDAAGPPRPRASVLEMARLCHFILRSCCGVTADLVHGGVFTGGWAVFESAVNLANQLGYADDAAAGSVSPSESMGDRIRRMSAAKSRRSSVAMRQGEDSTGKDPVVATLDQLTLVTMHLSSGVVDDPKPVVLKVLRHMEAASLPTPVHALMLWAAGDLLIKVHQRCRSAQGLQNSLNASGIGIPMIAEGGDDDDSSAEPRPIDLGSSHRSSLPRLTVRPEDVLSLLEDVLAMFDRVAGVYPSVRMVSSFMAGYVAETVAGSKAHYIDTVEQAVALGIPESSLAWRARVRLLLLSNEADGDKAARGTIALGYPRYAEDMKHADLLKAMHRDALRMRLFKSPEAQLLSEVL